MIVTYIRVPVLVYGRARWYQLSSFHWFLAHVIIIPYRFAYSTLVINRKFPKLIRKVRSLLSLSGSPNVKLFIKPFSQYSRTPLFQTRLIRSPRYFEDRILLDLPFPFTLPRLFRNPAISIFFFSFPLGLRNSGVRL